MTFPFSIVTIFAEDARQETSGQTTLVGILPDNLNVPGFPSAVPKLAIFTRVSAPADVLIPDLSLWLRNENGDEHELYSFDAEMLKQAKIDGGQNGAPLYGLVGQAVASPFPVASPGRITIVARSNGEEQLTGSLGFATAS